MRKQQREDLEKRKERIEDDMKVRLQRDRERERARAAGDNHELEDAKDEVLREHDTRIRERKRQVEKGIRESIKQQRERFDEE